ncbi:MAG TPA: PQQ-binding-like beta-propeller repeat protein [Pirellulales bacterium]|nr:PQQ-binding-like beta-propeller repeat protein [Pirellulales bacterium]
MRSCGLVALCLLVVTAPARADDWPQFRGPDGQGHAGQRGLPLEWSEGQNIVWKAPVPGLGWSSPTILGRQIWLTTALDEGRSLHVVCMDRETGEVQHDVEAFQIADPGKIHSKNSHASPSPILEGDRVYVHFGDNGTACLSTDGKVLWRNQELIYAHGHGPGGSPVLYKDLLIVSCDGTDRQFVAALDKHSGKLRWQTKREGRMAYSTPLVIHAAGRDQVISTGGDAVVSYNPADGEEIWRVRYDGYSEVPRPVYGQGLVFICSGYNTPLLYAIRPDGEGDVTDTHVAWKTTKAAPLNPSPLLIGEELYFVSDRGVAVCADAKTGEQHWQKRLPGNYSASPLAADGRIYFTNETGETTVIAPGKEFKSLASNLVDGRTLASLAVSGKAIYLRTDTHLYRIEER